MTSLLPATTLDSHALAAATALAEQLADPATVQARGTRRRGQSLAGGAAGIALLHVERARTGHGDPTIAHAWLRAATREPLSAGPNASLYFGAPTLAFVLHAADRPRDLTDVLPRLDRATVAVTQRRLAAAHARLNSGRRPALAEFDLIRGLAGLGRYHLHRGHPITADILTYLIRLTEPRDGDERPGWWTDLDPSGAPSDRYPHGHGNAGMSHGIAAPLALLAQARLHDIQVDGQRDAIDRICTWLDSCRGAGPAWPGIVTHPVDDQEPGRPRGRQRPSWCYGTPGIARAYQLAALATSDTTRRRTAETVMVACLHDPAQLDQLTDIGLCHGLAGLLHTAYRIATDATTPDLATALPPIVQRLLDRLPAAHSDPELLDGLAGVALTLHTAATHTTPVTNWDAAFLLA
ncbi:class I lanthipeptide synthase [Frankia sp. AiPs1]|uniref:lanthionine synthetase C family protein n=1 Tax=Frankia sp. AiPa1 TaxID=573492 RepID=UPI00202BA365|nr:lanthionine synthetase C family protein [Frankia sp. AiPa1]MCL9760406.1 lanthionine synthetase C family protein [Frankia sp. AiPa1]